MKMTMSPQDARDLTYGYFRCELCEDRWAEELIPMHSDDWPKSCGVLALLVTPLIRVGD